MRFGAQMAVLVPPQSILVRGSIVAGGALERLSLRVGAHVPGHVCFAVADVLAVAPGASKALLLPRCRARHAGQNTFFRLLTPREPLRRARGAEFGR